MICPQCKSTSFKESRQCPKFDGEPVCITCCYSCKYYGGHSANLKCRYHIHNPKPDYKGDIEKVDRQIHYKMRQIEHFYSTNRPRVAEKIEFEVIDLMAKKKELEKLI